METETGKLATVLPVAGGKGGVGKSIFTANLGRALAAKGEKCVAIDLDLGGSNLHTFLGFENIHPGIGDYLNQKELSLPEFLIPVPGADLSYIPGDGLRPFLANILHAHKMRILRELTRIRADTILLDLGAGTSYNTLDFFRVWGLGLVVTTPEYPSIINMMNFVKNVVLRTIVKGIGDNTFMTDIIEPISKQSIDADVKTIPEIIDELALINWERTDRIRQQLATLRFGLIVNRVKKSEDLQFVNNVLAALKRKLGVNIEWYGSLFEEDSAQLGWHAPRGEDDVPRLTGLGRIADRVRQRSTIDQAGLVAEAQALQQYLEQ
ncbi:MAG: hypothetical protein C0623_01365 [Desulfuromonas sp.]|nr:MAG: hypothetical protein C0623_01365 [Desulfuromonas sp.]